MYSVFASYRDKIARLPQVIPRLRVRHASTEILKLSCSRRRYTPRSISPYSYYLSKELAALNKALPVGKRITIHDREQRKLIDERWRALTPEERAAFDESNGQKYAATGRSLADHEREDMAILEDVAKGMSEYLDQLRGVKSLSFSEFRSFSWLRQDHRDRILQHSWVLRKRDIANVMRPFINTQFAEIVDHKRLKMSYTSFDTLVARVFGVTIENWPPIRFAAPGLVKSFSDMVGFYLMWKSGATRFRRLSAQEKKEWDATRLKLYKEHRRSSAPSTPRVRVPSRERPVHRLLIDPKVIGTVDQIAAFMDPALVPKRTEFGRGKAVMQENDESQTPLPNP